MKKLTLALLAVAAVSAPAQVKDLWKTTLTDPNGATRTMATVVTPNGHTIVLSYLENSDLRITRYDGAGVQVWSENLGTSAHLYRAIYLRTDAAGNAFCAYRKNGADLTVAKVDENGTISWSKTLTELISLSGFEVDATGNPILLGPAWSQGSNGGPAIKKLSPLGDTLGFKEITELDDYSPMGLAVAGNGQIYFTTRHPANGNNAAVALTPNLTLRYKTLWPSSYYATPAADRNGRFATTEYNGVNKNLALVRTFSSTGTFKTLTFTLGAPAERLRTTFDANGRLVVATQLVKSPAPSYVSVVHLAMSDTASFENRAEVVDTSRPLILNDLFADAFGQTYVAGQWKLNQTYGFVSAFDEYHTTPLWSTVDPNGAMGYEEDVSGAVGRWGQVALATTLGTIKLFEGTTGIRQLGLRNLTINGQSFTGGRTITGTVNFYGSSTMDRVVPLTSNTSFAQVDPSSTIVAGTSQSTMSIVLQPTSVRRAVAIEGMFNGTKRKAVFYIEPPVAASVTLFPTTTKGGKVVNATARLNGIAPTAGIVANMGSSSAAASVPPTVTIASGQISKGFTIGTTPVSQTQAATISMTTGDVTKTASLTITP